MTEFEKVRDEICRNFFDAKYPANCRKPSGEEWSFEESQSLQLCREIADWTHKWCNDKTRKTIQESDWYLLQSKIIDKLTESLNKYTQPPMHWPTECRTYPAKWAEETLTEVRKLQNEPNN